MKKADQLETEAVSHIRSLMAASARTAPKTRGIDNIEVLVLENDRTKNIVVKKMREISKKEGRPGMERDANSIENSPAVIVIGVRNNPAGLDCGFCGYLTCRMLKRSKGVCAFNSIDLGIAASSAAGIAGQFHVDNRIMYSIGRACIALRLFGKEVRLALGIPLSVTGKNPYFDRK